MQSGDDDDEKDVDDDDKRSTIIITIIRKFKAPKPKARALYIVTMLKINDEAIRSGLVIINYDDDDDDYG